MGPTARVASDQSLKATLRRRVPAPEMGSRKGLPMSNQEMTSVTELIGRTVVDANGEELGTVEDVYVDDVGGQPEWLALSTGWFGNRLSFVPIEGISYGVSDALMVAYTSEQVKNAPHEAADGHLSEDEESELYAYYGRTAGTFADASAGGVGDTSSTYEDGVSAVGDVVAADTGYDTSGPNTDDAMTRSEEELRVDKHVREAGRARLRKWIETENVQMTVPIRREMARVVTEPITDANIDRAMSGPDLSTEEHEVVLTEEVLDVDKRVVPKERVRLETEEITEDVAVDETVRRERIGYEGDDEATPR